jgi:hypothetical protein
MLKDGADSSIAVQQAGLEKREKTFYFLEGIGTLLWVLGDVSWIFGLEHVFPVIYALAVLGNSAALAFAFLRLRHTLPLMPIIAYNLWVIMGCLWTFVDVTGSAGLLLAAKTAGGAVLLITMLEFIMNRNIRDNFLAYVKIFRKFRIREENPGLSVADVLSLPDDLFDLIKWMVKQKRVGLPEVASFMKQNEAGSLRTLAFLAERGYIKEIETGGKTLYIVRLDTRKGLPVPLDLQE